MTSMGPMASMEKVFENVDGQQNLSGLKGQTMTMTPTKTPNNIP